MIIKIEMPLPFYIPIEAETKIITDYTNREIGIFSLKIAHIQNDNIQTNIDRLQTILHVDFSPHNITYEQPVDGNLLRAAVEHSLIYINRIIDAFRLTSNAGFLRNITINDLPVIINIMIEDAPQLYITVPTVIAHNVVYSVDDVRKSLTKIQAWDVNNYFEVIDKFQSKALYYLHSEEFIHAIISLQTSFEAYIRLCHNLILLETGADSAKIEAAKDWPLKNTIVDHIGKALKTNLDYVENPIMKEWNENLYILRNKIVHSGHSYISGDDAYKAFDSYEAVILYISELMVKEGFMDEGGKVFVRKLNKNTPLHVDLEEVVKILVEKGFLSPDVLDVI